jgi:hypothetical protein
MSNPLHTSLELPQRCLQLIDELWAAVEDTKEKQHPELGSLTTTFLLAMSMPIINLPMERLVNGRHIGKYANDRHLDKAVTDAIDRVVGGRPLKDAPFYTPDTWSFFTSGPDLNIAEPMPDNITGALSSKKSSIRRKQNACVGILQHLTQFDGSWRNSLSGCEWTFDLRPSSCNVRFC